MPFFNFSNLPDNNFLYFGNAINTPYNSVILYNKFMLALIASSPTHTLSLINENLQLTPFINQPAGGTTIAIAISRDINRVYCVKSGGAFQFTDNDGATAWGSSAFSPATAYNVAALKNVVIVGTNSVGYSRSTDYGVTFTGGPFGVANVASTTRNAVYSDVAGNRIYFCGSNGANFIISYTDDGVIATSQSFTAAQIGTVPQAISVVNGRVFFGTQGGRMFSINPDLNTASLISHPTPNSSPIKDIAQINGTAYITTSLGIFKLVGNNFVPLPQTPFVGATSGNNIVKYNNDIYAPSSSGFITSLKND